jgi:hypothetical protein
MKKSCLFFVAAALLVLLISVPCFSQTAQPGSIKFTPGMTIGSLAGRADSDMLELPSGRRMTVGDARRLHAATQRLRGAAAGGKGSPLSSAKPAATGTPIKSPADLAAALKRPDNETIQLPNGKLITVAQLRFLQPLAEKRLGRKLDASAGSPAGSDSTLTVKSRADLTSALSRPDSQTVKLPSGAITTVGEIKAVRAEIEKRLGRSLDASFQRTSLTGQAIKVPPNATKTDLQNLLKQPDSTILESPNGRRTTVGALKKLIADTNAVRKTLPGTGAPAPASGQLSAPSTSTPGPVPPAGPPRNPAGR